MFDNFLRVLDKGKSESIQLDKLWEDAEAMFMHLSVLDTPAEPISFDWLKTTEWYKQGGYKEVRAAAYPSIGDQLDMLYKVEWDDWREKIEAVKIKWEKPCQ